MNDRITAAASNSAALTQQASVSITDTTRLDASVFQLILSGATEPFNYTLTRLDDGNIIASGLLANAYPQSILTDQGFTIHLESGAFQAGDQFLIDTSTSAARQMDLLIGSPAALAMASPVSFEPFSTNTGTAKASIGDTLTVSDMNLSALDTFLSSEGLLPPLLIRFTSANSYDVLDNSDPNSPQLFDPPIRNQRYEPDQTNQILPYSEDSMFWSGDASQVFSVNIGATGTVKNGYPGGGFVSETITSTTIDPLTGATAISNRLINNDDSAEVIALSLIHISEPTRPY